MSRQLWTPNLERDFHRAVETLHEITENPTVEASYCQPSTEADSENYVFRLRDELQLINHIAFLAHSQEGVKSISGACAEEVRGGLIIRLASNHTPSPDTVSGLRKILSTVSGGAGQGQLHPDFPETEPNVGTVGSSRVTLQESIFEDVLSLS